MNKTTSEYTKAKLRELIADRLANAPFERGGKQWAAFHQKMLAKALGTTERTLYSWTEKPPFQREIALIDGEKRTLLRMIDKGETPTKTPQHVANIMRKVWAEKVGTKLDGKQHGCLIGLAKDWPDGHQVAIFKCVLNDWSGFMTLTKMELQAFAAEKGVTLKNDTPLEQSYLAKLGLAPDPKTLPQAEGLEVRYFKYPTITYIRAFHPLAVELYTMKLQAGEVKGGPKLIAPKAVKAPVKTLELA